MSYKTRYDAARGGVWWAHDEASLLRYVCLVQKADYLGPGKGSGEGTRGREI